ncbi:restriction endonuclease subunit S [Enterobacter cloacae]|uniref:restriction endonuclease subunit S n=1 Tax=Enterobacter cloacae TaxID=550 RepID=UPI003D1E2942|nr:restriction endonuclease subunit S [Enterobacter cloacae]HBC0589556.1 restriction endonuclease subunit S [Enterobacter cloacae]
MAKYKAYPEYKDSGVEWLGEVPNHWKTISISRLFSRVKRTGYTEKELLSVYRDYGVIPKSSRDDNNNKPSEDLSPYQLVQPNDLVMNKMKAWQGSIAISEYEGIVSPAYFVYQPNNSLFELAHPKYVHYLLRNPIYVTQYLSRSKGIRVNQWDLDPDEFRNIEILLPSKVEQEKIYSFLDHETAKIDNLIEKQQQLIELLKEKRQAVISHAVTKGLNPDVPMKDSCVEWLGDVPAHWTVTKVKNVCYLIDGDRGVNYPNESDYVDNGIPFFSSKNITDFELTTNNLSYISTAKFNSLGRGKLKHNDLIITVRGTIGHVAKFDRNIIGCDTGFINAQMMIIRPKEMLTQFILLVSESLYWKQQLNVSAYGSTVKQLSNEVIGNFKICLPPAEELIAIENYLDSLNKMYSKLIGNVLHQIELMQERRTALISAAVTGKIDVRDWVAPDAQGIEKSQEAIA